MPARVTYKAVFRCRFGHADDLIAFLPPPAQIQVWGYVLQTADATDHCTDPLWSNQPLVFNAAEPFTLEFPTYLKSPKGYSIFIKADGFASWCANPNWAGDGEAPGIHKVELQKYFLNSGRFEVERISPPTLLDGFQVGDVVTFRLHNLKIGTVLGFPRIRGPSHLSEDCGITISPRVSVSRDKEPEDNYDFPSWIMNPHDRKVAEYHDLSFALRWSGQNQVTFKLGQTAPFVFGSHVEPCTIQLKVYQKGLKTLAVLEQLLKTHPLIGSLILLNSVVSLLLGVSNLISWIIDRF